MKKFRILTLASVFALSGLMTGCFEDSTSSSSAPVIETFSIANFDEAQNTWAIGDSLEFWGEVSDDNSIVEIKLEILNSSNASVATFTKVTSASSLDFGKAGANDYSLTTSGYIKNPGTWAAGSYTAKLTVKDNDGLTASKSIAMANVAGNGTTNPTTLKDTTVTLGGTGSSYGSYLDADAMKVYKSSEASANASAIDLVFNNTDDGKNEVRSPSDASWLTWTPKNTTKVLKVTATFESITTQAAIDALYNSSTASTTLQGIVANDVLVVHTSANKNVLIKVSSIANSGAATVEFAVKGYK